ncbi:MAG TPA: tetratricopeptide repeat protein [Caulobacteraceae bacterium]|jgi:predicted O-linked N-acetylglucosamine transferase (SPINDLY family)|nr:tetratricopeptide repeat protein [Caulobacteraceae bacterium]
MAKGKKGGAAPVQHRPGAPSSGVAARVAEAEAHQNLGAAALASGRPEEAAEAFRRVIALLPGYAGGRYNLGHVLQALGRPGEAAEAYRQAIALQPDHLAAHNSLGAVLKAMGRPDEAAACYRRALELKPDFAEGWYNLGAVFLAAGRLDEAADAYRRALDLKPDYAEAHANLGNAFQAMGRFADAAAAYQRAIDLKPDFATADSNRLLCLLYSPDITPGSLLAEHRRWDERHGRRPGPSPAAHANPREPGRRLRIGYVSADFGAHPVGWFLTRVLAAHDRAAFEVSCYDNGGLDDEVTARLRASAHHWRNLVGVGDDDAAAMVRGDGIDILVDLSGHTAKNRLPLFTRRPAPVQASWLGYPGTTGLSSIDYLVMDTAVMPPGAERRCSEAVVRLLHSRFCYDPPAYAPAVADPGGQPVTFGSFNNLTKVGPEVVRLWTAVLEAAPGSRLVLKSKSLADPAARRRLEDAFAACGLAPDRLELRGASPHAQMLAEYGGVDIALDPFPFCGGLTSCEALWMGVPVVTLPGDRPASRQTLGFLDALGLGEFAAGSPADYVRVAAALAADPERRAQLRRSLRPRMAASSLCDGPLFASALESALRAMWRRWCAGEPPAAIG